MTGEKPSKLSEVSLPSPLHPIRLPHWPDTAPKVWIKRDDLIHPIISGNKWRKLVNTDFSTSNRIVSIGGGFSNHLHALGYLCKTLHLPFTALVRGDYQQNMTPTLKDLKQWSTDIVFINRVTYEQRDTPEFLNDITRQYPGSLFIPEGGSTQSALTGVRDICEEINGQLSMAPSHILAPVASGATLAGIISASQPETRVMGIAVLKGEEYLEQQVSRFLELEHTNWLIRHEFVHGGYAKRSSRLTAFIGQFIEHTGVPIEPVYSGKLFYALDQLIQAREFNAEDTIVALHTGGLQGDRSN